MKPYMDKGHDFSKKIIAWGAGNYFERYHSPLDSQICRVLDSDRKKQGHVLHGHLISSPEALKAEKAEDCLMVVFCASYKPVFEEIKKYGAFEAIDVRTYLLLRDLKAAPYFLQQKEVKRLILSVANAEAMWQVNGCSKFIRLQAQEIRKAGYSHVQLVPIPMLTTANENGGMVAVTYNGNYEGIYCLRKLIECRNEFAGVIVHSLFEEESILEDILKSVKVTGRILYYLHDYFVICKQRFLYMAGKACLQDDGQLRCGECRLGEEQRVHHAYWRGLFEKYQVLLVAPSESAKKITELFYDSESIVVLPHQTYRTVPFARKSALRKRIAYIGRAGEEKGWNEFLKIRDGLGGEYELYCLGQCRESQRPEGIRYIAVGEKGNGISRSMLQALRDNQIDIAYLGSLCPETYSYVYFECYEAGVFTIAYEGSGNIAAEIRKNKNGKVFGSTEQMIVWLSDREAVESALDGPCGKIADLCADTRFLQYMA